MSDTPIRITQSAAEVYEEFFVPALFAQWAAPLVEAAGVEPGDRVLDVACGTGVAAREAKRRTAARGGVVGLDSNPGMLEVARRVAPGIRWECGRAESLPFDDASFDAVLCQFALMFFEDRRRALVEMQRVLRPGGRLAVAVWGELDACPGYADLVRLLADAFGQEIADELRAPFSLGDERALRALLASAGLDGAELSTHAGTASFPSLADWMHTDVKGWTLADRLDDAQYAELHRRAELALGHHVHPDGRVEFPVAARFATAVRR